MKTGENVRVYVLVKGEYYDRKHSLFFVCIETAKRNVKYRAGGNS
jgi:hypothetical protein